MGMCFISTVDGWSKIRKFYQMLNSFGNIEKKKPPGFYNLSDWIEESRREALRTPFYGRNRNRNKICGIQAAGCQRKKCWNHHSKLFVETFQSIATDAFIPCVWYEIADNFCLAPLTPHGARNVLWTAHSIGERITGFKGSIPWESNGNVWGSDPWCWDETTIHGISMWRAMNCWHRIHNFVKFTVFVRRKKLWRTDKKKTPAVIPKYRMTIQKQFAFFPLTFCTWSSDRWILWKWHTINYWWMIFIYSNQVIMLFIIITIIMANKLCYLRMFFFWKTDERLSKRSIY